MTIGRRRGADPRRRKLQPIVASLLVAATLAGCSVFPGQSPEVTNAPPPGISYRYRGSVADAQSKAESYCGQWGKQATLDNTKPVGTDRIATFSCS
jgi:hypothetical protein